MLVTHDHKTELFQAFVLAGQKLVLFTSSGEKKELGTLKDNVFTPSKAAEDSYYFDINSDMNWWGNISPWNNFGTYNWGRYAGNSGSIGGFHGNMGGNYGTWGGTYGTLGGNYGTLGGNYGTLGRNYGSYGSDNSLGSGLGLYAWWLYLI
jgi:hypothetical protein